MTRNPDTAHYLARLSGSAWADGPEAACATITEARRWAESYRRHPIVAVHRRNPDGDGRRWYRAVPPPEPIDDGRTIDRDPLARLR